eukprot:CAMPEP_0194082610 /NCGR_PEP_ID=MMETSP0149-20130528/8070_1 /TAXON_ID=122233 /ORGANISM="Chaetoceros debilis, Strain MM31A-1" /LENGTH=196 /DNA_ID=CAMNT_0038764799 /DNA_START=812 /DNA_END=1405 /DNA_ORIENTATION=-
MANNTTRKTFLKMLLFIGLASTSTAFTVNTSITQTHNAAISPLFNAVTVPANRSRSLSQRTHIQMTEENSNSDDDADITPSPIVEVDSSAQSSASASAQSSASASASESTPSKKKERSGFVTALVMGPPLIFKFGIVLVVKVLTDLVVFPLLWLYRACRLVKNKVLGLLPASLSSSINGDGVSDKDIRKGKVNGHS